MCLNLRNQNRLFDFSLICFLFSLLLPDNNKSKYESTYN